jgi:hypothetical protein
MQIQPKLAAQHRELIMQCLDSNDEPAALTSVADFKLTSLPARRQRTEILLPSQAIRSNNMDFRSQFL